MGGILFHCSYNIRKKTLLPPDILNEAVTEWIRSIQSKKMSGAFAMATPPVPSAEADGRDWGPGPSKTALQLPSWLLLPPDSSGCTGKDGEQLPSITRQGRILGMTLAWMLPRGCSTSPSPGQLIQSETAGHAKRGKKKNRPKEVSLQAKDFAQTKQLFWNDLNQWSFILFACGWEEVEWERKGGSVGVTDPRIIKARICLP